MIEFGVSPADAWKMDMRDWWICFKWRTKKTQGPSMSRKRFNEMMEMYPDA